MPDIAITITLNQEAGTINISMPTDFLLTQKLLHDALGESLKREIESRTAPVNPGVKLSRVAR